MSFNVELHTCNLGKRVRKTKNPFTGEPIEVPIDPGLTRSEREAVLALLAEVKATGPDPDFYYRVNFPDGGSADIATGGLDGQHPTVAFGVEVWGLTDDLAVFLFKLAEAGNMSIMPIMEDSVTVLTSPPRDQKVRERWPEAAVMDSPAQLQRLLMKGYRAWERYRDQVLKEES